VPCFDAPSWDFQVTGLVARPASWTWDEFQSLPLTTTEGDFHCVTRWSTFDHTWTGVSPRLLVDAAEADPRARFALLHGEGGYTANVPIAVLLDPDAIFALLHDGEPLTPEHGGPLRAVIPSRYAWKSVKWLRGIELLAEDQPGFWEGYGYSNSADPWREERFES
jgi:DMSO/TMAO reductase YedYZ molybdopterin-dependent catalytic subunit